MSKPQQMTTPGVVGQWSVKDLVAHITWSEREMVGMPAARALVGSDLWSLTNDERNEIVYQQNRDHPLDEVLAEGKSRRRPPPRPGLRHEPWLNSTIPLSSRSMPADWLPWRVIAGNTYIHYREHAQNLQDWLDAQAALIHFEAPGS